MKYQKRFAAISSPAKTVVDGQPAASASDAATVPRRPERCTVRHGFTLKKTTPRATAKPKCPKERPVPVPE